MLKDNCSVLRQDVNAFQFVLQEIPVAVKAKSTVKKFVNASALKNNQDWAAVKTDIGTKNLAHANVYQLSLALTMTTLPSQLIHVTVNATMIMEILIATKN